MIFVYVLLGLLILLLAIALLLPKNYNIEKSTIIKKSIADVMDKVANLNFYSQWNPWQQNDPTAKSTVSGTPKTAGHKYVWKGKKVGVGALTLLEMDQKHIHFDLEFFKPFKSKAKDNWLFEPWGDSSETKVTWQNSGGLPFPVARLMGPMILKKLNYQFEEGLGNLKKLCEA